MARLDIDIICSRCEDSLSATSDIYNNKILPCDCVVKEIEELETKIKELEEQLDESEQTVSDMGREIIDLNKYS